MPSNTTQQANQQVLREIERALGEIQFGSLEITLHEGRVTQIERREKMRLTSDRLATPAHVLRAR